MHKISFYSRWANCYSLEHFIRQKEAKLLNKDQLDTMTIQLVTALYSLHQIKIIYQDLKPKNILVFRDESHQYHLALIDFGSAYDPLYAQANTTALATLGYESPEVALYHKLHPKTRNHRYFSDTSFFSYGRELSSHIKYNPEFEFPNPLNGAFALGILLDTLYHQRAFTKTSVKTLSPIVTALLYANREYRLSIDQLYFQLCSEGQKVSVLRKSAQPEEKGSKDLDDQLANLTLNSTFVPTFRRSTTPKDKPVKSCTIHVGSSTVNVRDRQNSFGTLK